MAGILVISLLTIIFFYKDPLEITTNNTREEIQQKEDEPLIIGKKNVINYTKEEEDVENKFFPPKNNGQKNFFQKFSEYKSIINKASVSLLLIRFLATFNMTALETLITPLTNTYYHFKQFHNSLLFFGITIVMIAFFLLLGLLSKKFQDRSLILMSFVIQGVGLEKKKKNFTPFFFLNFFFKFFF